MSGRGGHRSGAGRPKGAIGRRTEEAIAAAEESGETPLAYMLRVMRDPSADAPRRDDMAKAAASYLHPRLAAVEHSGGLKLSHDDWVDGLAEPDDAGTGDGKAKAGD